MGHTMNGEERNQGEGSIYANVHICEREAGVFEVPRADPLTARREGESEVGWRLILQGLVKN